MPGIGSIWRRVLEVGWTDELELENFRLEDWVPYIWGDCSLTCGSWNDACSRGGKKGSGSALRTISSTLQTNRSLRPTNLVDGGL